MMSLSPYQDVTASHPAQQAASDRLVCSELELHRQLGILTLTAAGLFCKKAQKTTGEGGSEPATPLKAAVWATFVDRRPPHDA